MSVKCFFFRRRLGTAADFFLRSVSIGCHTKLLVKWTASQSIKITEINANTAKYETNFLTKNKKIKTGIFKATAQPK